MSEWSFDGDFVKVPRKLVELLAAEPIALALYNVLLARAAWRPRTQMTKHGAVDLEAGQLLCGRSELAATLELGSDRSIRTAMERLKTIKAIRVESDKRGTKVTICGYAQRPPDPVQQNAETGPTERQDPVQAPAAVTRRLGPGNGAPRPAPVQAPVQQNAETGPTERRDRSTNVDHRSEIRDPRSKTGEGEPLPPDWKPNEEHEQLLRRQGLTWSVVERFQSHFRANRRKSLDWSARFTEWIWEDVDKREQRQASKNAADERPLREFHFGGPRR